MNAMHINFVSHIFLPRTLGASIHYYYYYYYTKLKYRLCNAKS